MAEIIEQYLKDDIELVRGGDYYETFNFLEDDDVTVVDTTDWEMVLEIRKSFPNGELYDELSTDNGRIVNTPASGQFNANWVYPEIDNYDFTSAAYRVVIIYADGKRQTWRVGNVRVV